MERRMNGTVAAAIGLVLCIIGALFSYDGWAQFIFIFVGVLAMIYGGWQWAWNAPEHEDEAGDIHFDESAFPLP